eukprot:gene3557-3825_t
MQAVPDPLQLPYTITMALLDVALLQLKLSDTNILLVGLGGVGSFAAEFLTRAGVGQLTIVDGDSVDTTNRNRQLPALHSTVGQLKAHVVAQRLQDINPQLRLTVKQHFLDPEAAAALVEEQPYNYLVDAIDSVAPKQALLLAGVRAGCHVCQILPVWGASDREAVRAAGEAGGSVGHAAPGHLTQLAASASSGGKARAGRAVCEVRHQKSSQGALWAPDGSGRLLSISFDDTLKVWADRAGPAAADARLKLEPKAGPSPGWAELLGSSHQQRACLYLAVRAAASIRPWSASADGHLLPWPARVYDD